MREIAPAKSCTASAATVVLSSWIPPPDPHVEHPGVESTAGDLPQPPHLDRTSNSNENPTLNSTPSPRPRTLPPPRAHPHPPHTPTHNPHHHHAPPRAPLTHRPRSACKLTKMRLHLDPCMHPCMQNVVFSAPRETTPLAPGPRCTPSTGTLHQVSASTTTAMRPAHHVYEVARGRL